MVAGKSRCTMHQTKDYHQSRFSNPPRKMPCKSCKTQRVKVQRRQRPWKGKKKKKKTKDESENASKSTIQRACQREKWSSRIEHHRTKDKRQNGTSRRYLPSSVVTIVGGPITSSRLLNPVFPFIAAAAAYTHDRGQWNLKSVSDEVWSVIAKSLKAIYQARPQLFRLRVRERKAHESIKPRSHV